MINQTRLLLLPPHLTLLTKEAFYHLKRDNMPATGAAKAYHESQSRIFKTEAPQFVGAGEGTDNLDFLPDLSAPKVINPDTILKEPPSEAGPVPESPSTLLSQLMLESIPYSHCAWYDETKSIMWCCNHLVVPHHQYYRQSWEWNCILGKQLLDRFRKVVCI